MAFDIRRTIVSGTEGESFNVGPDGLILNGKPVMHHVNGITFVQDICILTPKKLARLVSADGDGVLAREEIRERLKQG